MPLTREENRTVDELVKRVRKLEIRVQKQELLINQLLDIVNRIDTEVTMEDWTSDQWEEFLEPFISTRVTSSILSIHDHTSNPQGGPAFAKLGATLIE